MNPIFVKEIVSKQFKTSVATLFKVSKNFITDQFIGVINTFTKISEK